MSRILYRQQLPHKSLYLNFMVCQLSRVLALAFLCAVILPVTVNAQSDQAFDVIEYTAEIEPDLEAGRLTGLVTVAIMTGEVIPDEIVLDSGNLQIDEVKENGIQLSFQQSDSQLRIYLDKTSLKKEYEIEIRYHGTPAWGMNFSLDGEEVSTAFSTSQWLPSIDSPSERARLRLTLILPRDFQVVGNGRLVGTQNRPYNKTASSFFQDKPMPGYLFGFVGGKFREVVDASQNPILRFLSPPGFSESELTKIFENTRDMIEFFEQKSGIPYPGEYYSQVLLRAGSGQEMDGFAVMGEAYGREVLRDESAIWLGAHEVAHQWWGNGLTNASWEHFWLNEGIGSFMTAAYLEHRFGRDSYLENINGARTSYESIRDAGNDKPLVFPNWDSPSRDDRSLVYDKGSYIVHLLREYLGEDVFWDGLQAYTKRYWGKSVTTVDFQDAMEEAARVDLTDFFDQWVF